MKNICKYYSYYRITLGESWLVMLAVFMLGGNLLAAAIVMGVSLFFPEIDLMNAPWATLYLYLLPFLFTSIYVFLRSKGCYKQFNVHSTPYVTLKPRLGKVPFPVFVLCLPLAIVSLQFLVEPVTSWLEMPEFMKDLLEKMTENNLPTFLAVVIAAPILEEALCRAFALRGMLCHMAPWKAILWSAIMFGVIHMNPWQAAPAIMIGLLMGWIYYRTRSYWACVALHALNNGLSFLLSFLFPDLAADTTLLEFIGPKGYYIGLAASAVVLALIVYYLYKNLAPGQQETRKTCPNIEENGNEELVSPTI